MDKICCFFGHRKIEDRERIRRQVAELVEKRIKEGFTLFLFGEFDELCHEVVSHLKQSYPQIRRVYCVTEERHLRQGKRPKHLSEKDYEEFSYLQPSFEYWYKRIYYRNCAMIEKSNFILFYAEERKDSGAYKALLFTKKSKKEYVNIYSASL